MGDSIVTWTVLANNMPTSATPEGTNEAQTAPRARRYHVSFVHSRSLWVFGGVAIKTPLADLWRFDLDSRNWTCIDPQGEPPAARYGAQHFFDSKCGILYLFGGTQNGKVALAENFLHRYDIALNTWSRLESDVANFPAARYYACGCFSQTQRKYFMFGGNSMLSKYHGDLWQFDCDHLTWKKLSTKNASLPKPRAGGCLFYDEGDNIISLYGGFTDDGGYTPLIDFHAIQLSPSKDDILSCAEKESFSGSLPCVLRPISVARIGDLVWIFGGYDGQKPVGHLYTLDLKSARWSVNELWMSIGEEMDESNPMVQTKMAQMTPRYGHSLDVVDNDTLVLFAGSGSLFINDVIELQLNN